MAGKSCYARCMVYQTGMKFLQFLKPSPLLVMVRQCVCARVCVCGPVMLPIWQWLAREACSKWITLILFYWVYCCCQLFGWCSKFRSSYTFRRIWNRSKWQKVHQIRFWLGWWMWTTNSIWPPRRSCYYYVQCAYYIIEFPRCRKTPQRFVVKFMARHSPSSFVSLSPETVLMKFGVFGE